MGSTRLVQSVAASLVWGSVNRAKSALGCYGQRWRKSANLGVMFPAYTIQIKSHARNLQLSVFLRYDA